MATWKWGRASGHVSAAFVLAATSGCGITDAGGSGSCRIDDKIYADGTTFSPDGCNQCRCDDGRSECTLMACQKACGGELGGRCDAHEYCAYTSECGFGDGAAYCATRPAACPEIQTPVCGCDGRTYASACEAGRAGTGYLHEGSCEGGPSPGCRVNGAFYPEGSTDIPAPDSCNTCRCDEGQLLCTTLPCPAPRMCGGSAGQSCAASQFCAYEGWDCRLTNGAVCKPRPVSCAAIERPVCGCDGNTYSNSCEAARSGVGFQYEGKCGMPGDSCTINGQTYPDGATKIPSGDGCGGTCTCEAGRLDCIWRLCPPG